jgi:hypothetical protein
MLCCVAYVAVLVMGIVTLVRQELALTGSKLVRGTPAIWIGILLILAAVASAGIEVAFSVLVLAPEAMRKGPLAPAEEYQFDLIEIAIRAGVFGVILLLVVVIAFVNAESRAEVRRKKEQAEREQQGYANPEDDLTAPG